MQDKKSSLFPRKSSQRILPFNLQFHSYLNKVSGKGCVVDITLNTKGVGNRADIFAYKMSELIASSSKIVLYLSNPFSLGLEKNSGNADSYNTLEKKRGGQP